MYKIKGVAKSKKMGNRFGEKITNSDIGCRN